MGRRCVILNVALCVRHLLSVHVETLNNTTHSYCLQVAVKSTSQESTPESARDTNGFEVGSVSCQTILPIIFNVME